MDRSLLLAWTKSSLTEDCSNLLVRCRRNRPFVRRNPDPSSFVCAVMPIGGWKGLTYDDDSQAVAICQVMKKFTDKGLEVWLRFAHEVNWYQRASLSSHFDTPTDVCRFFSRRRNLPGRRR